MLASPDAHSLPELSLAAPFRRRWPNVYAALRCGTTDRTALRTAFATHAPLPPPGQGFRLGVDAVSHFRPYAATARDRLALPVPNLPTRRPVCRPGWQFSSLCLLPAAPGSATYTLDTLRIPTTSTPCAVAADQLAACVPLLPRCLAPAGQELWPVAVGDRGYGQAAFLGATRTVRAHKLLRCRANSVFYRPPPPRTGKRGAPKKHGAAFQCKDATTHGAPTANWTGGDADGRPVLVAGWYGLHLRTLPELPVDVIRVTRPQAAGTARDERVSWFVWAGVDGAHPVLGEMAGEYGLRFSQEHGFRFAKQDLLWGAAHVQTPEGFQQWTDVVEAARNEVVLGLAAGVSGRQAWERAERAATPQQARRGLGGILGELGTPARAPKGRGKGRGRAPGALVKRAVRHPVVRKGRKRWAQGARAVLQAA